MVGSSSVRIHVTNASNYCYQTFHVSRGWGHQTKKAFRQSRLHCTSSTAIVSGLCKSSNFNVDSPGGSWSYIGTDAITIPVESFTMNFGFMDQPTVMHEFGHALGLIHEHQSPFKGGFEWNKKEVRNCTNTLL